VNSEEALIDDSSCDSCKSFLSKKIIKCLYFSTKPCYPELDISLHTLMYSKAYKKAFTSIRDKDTTFAEILKTYLEQTVFEQDKTLIKTYRYVSYLLNLMERAQEEIEDELLNYAILRFYCQCIQYMHEISDVQASSITTKYRQDTLQPAIVRRLAAIRERVCYPAYYADLRSIETSMDSEKQIFILLLGHLYGTKQPFEREPILRELVNTPEFVIKSPETKFLSDFYIVSLFSSGAELSLLEEKQLVAIFREYLETPTKWRTSFGMIFMEEMLFRFLYRHVSQNGVSKNFFPEVCSPRRDNGCSAMWHTVLGAYIDCKKAIEQKQLDSCESLLQAIEKEIPTRKSQDEEFYFELFTKCLKDLKEELNHEQVT
ncbi:MAG: hypothetical protein JSR46_07870, partial [Verrucomicrobia bacterium]|nr:hypothetical protein [Verrucomicrobiota bacterium]